MTIAEVRARVAYIRYRRESGDTCEAIATTLGVTKQRVAQICRQERIPCFEQRGGAKNSRGHHRRRREPPCPRVLASITAAKRAFWEQSA